MVYTRYDGDVLIDDRTGSPQQLPTGCTPLALTGTTLACQQPNMAARVTLDDLHTGRSTTLTVNPQLLQGCNPPGEYAPGEYACPSVSATGRDWVAFTGPAGNYHIGYFTVFQSRATGQLSDAATAPTHNLDLNAPGLTVPVCTPLKVPELQNADGVIRSGSLLSVGHGYEIATGNQSYLERCGTHLRLHLYSGNGSGSISASACVVWFCPPAVNAQSVVWAASTQPRWLGSISGVFLPSRRRFTITPTTKIPYTNGTVALTDHHLYIYANNRLWQGPTPTLPEH